MPLISSGFFIIFADAIHLLGNYILLYIEKKLFLKVNRTKTVVDYAGKVKFLGFTKG
jgi:hypothetical protein